MNKEQIIEMMLYIYEVDLDNCIMTHKAWITEVAEALTDPDYMDYLIKEYEECKEARC